MMDRLAAEIVVHGVVATSVVALLIHLQPDLSSSARFRLWLLALLGPVWLAPLYALLFPARLADAFRDDWALFSGSHWTSVAWHGVGAGAVMVLLGAGLGLLLVLRDFVPLAAEAGSARARGREVADRSGVLTSAVARAAQALDTSAPALHMWNTEDAVLACRGLRRPVIVASTGLVRLLAPNELAAALAHEIAHAKWRDPARGWVVVVLRAAFFFSPGLQVAARALVQTMESAADDSAARAIGDARTVAQALLKMVGDRDDRLTAWQRWKKRAIEHRCALVLSPGRTVSVSAAGMAAMATGLALLLFFTVA